MGYSVSGNKILRDGQEIQLVGVSAVGMETTDGVIGGLWTDLSIQQWVSQIKAMGLNTIRLPIDTKVLANVNVPQGTAGIWPGSQNHGLGLAGKGSLDILDLLIAEIDKQGLMYIFDLHHIEDGKIPDLWYTSRYSEQMWINDLVFLARRYKNSKGFVGIDTKNEPNGNTATWGIGNSVTDWKLASEKAFQAINLVNQDILNIVEVFEANNGLQQMIDKPLDIPADKLVLSSHIYGPDVWQTWGAGFNDPSFPANMPKVWDSMFGNIAQTHAFLIGETGGKYEPTTKDRAFFDTFFPYLKSRGVGHVLWWGLGADNSGGECGGLYVDGGWRKVRTDKLALLNSIKTDKFGYVGDAPKVSQPIPSAPVVLPTLPKPPSEEANLPEKIIIGGKDMSALTIPDTFKLMIEGQQPQSNSQVVNIPEQLKILLEGLQQTTIPEKLTVTIPQRYAVDSTLKLSVDIPKELSLNTVSRVVAPANIPDSIVRKYPLGSLVSLRSAPTLKMTVIAYAGYNVCVCYLNEKSGVVDIAEIPEVAFA